jgi:uncharacterized protein
MPLPTQVGSPLRGIFVEEHITFPVGDIVLEGLFWAPTHVPAVGVVVCHPHPLYGGDMHNNVVTALTEAF